MSKHPTPDATVFPEILHRYHNVSLIGQGGSGKVYRAERRDNGQVVAIKVLELRNKDSIKIKRFRREALAIASLNHQNIVRIHDLDVDSRDGDSTDNPNFLVMDWIEGQDLEVAQIELDQDHDSSLEWLLPVFTQIADALAHAHERGVIHRDLKPANIMIETDTKAPVLIDFGLVKIKTDKIPAYLSNYESLTKTGQALGTPRFMAPEQILGKKDRIDERADVWGFGATLYYCLTGSPPYPVNNVLDLFELIHGHDPSRAKKIVPNLPDWLDELCSRCLTRDSTLRPSMKEVYSVLKNQRIEHPNSPSYRQMGLVFGVISAFAMTLALFLDSTPAPELSIENQSSLTNSVSFPLKTRVKRGRPNVIIVSSSRDNTLREFPIAKEVSKLTLDLELSEGKHSLQIHAKDSKGRMGPPVQIEIEVDRSDPDFNFSAVKKVVYDSEFLLTGSVSEEGCRLSVAGRTVAATKFQFQIPLTLVPGNNTFTVICTDLAGNSSRKRLNIRRARNFVIGAVHRLPKVYRRVQSLKEALETADAGERLILAPGSYKGPLILDKPLIIECSDPQALALVQSESEFPTIDFQKTGRLELIGLKLENKGLGPTLLSKSPVALSRCQFSSQGQQNVVLDIPRKSLGNSTLVDCQFIGRSKIGLSLLSGNLFADRCSWTNQRDSAVIVQGHARLTIDGGHFQSNKVALSIQDKAWVKLSNCLIEKQKSHGLVVKGQAQFEAKDCKFLRNGAWAIHCVAGRGQLRRCRASENIRGGIRVEKDGQIDCWGLSSVGNAGPNTSSVLENGLQIHNE